MWPCDPCVRRRLRRHSPPGFAPWSDGGRASPISPCRFLPAVLLPNRLAPTPDFPLSCIQWPGFDLPTSNTACRHLLSPKPHRFAARLASTHLFRTLPGILGARSPRAHHPLHVSRKGGSSEHCPDPCARLGIDLVGQVIKNIMEAFQRYVILYRRICIFHLRGMSFGKSKGTLSSRVRARVLLCERTSTVISCYSGSPSCVLSVRLYPPLTLGDVTISCCPERLRGRYSGVGDGASTTPDNAGQPASSFGHYPVLTQTFCWNKFQPSG